MKIIQPWKIEIAQYSLLEQVDNNAITEEVHMLHCLSPRDSLTPLVVTPEQFPALCHFRDKIVHGLVVDYIRRVFGVEPFDIATDTFGKVFDKQQGLGSHLHGNSCLTSVYYPSDSDAGMSLADPRFNASRGYPRSIRDNHFGEFYVAPKAGDLWIMPSYIQHSVAPSTEEMRLSLINDFHFKA